MSFMAPLGTSGISSVDGVVQDCAERNDSTLYDLTAQNPIVRVGPGKANEITKRFDPSAERAPGSTLSDFAI